MDPISYVISTSTTYLNSHIVALIGFVAAVIILVFGLRFGMRGLHWALGSILTIFGRRGRRRR